MRFGVTLIPPSDGNKFAGGASVEMGRNTPVPGTQGVGGGTGTGAGAGAGGGVGDGTGDGAGVGAGGTGAGAGDGGAVPGGGQSSTSHPFWFSI